MNIRDVLRVNVWETKRELLEFAQSQPEVIKNGLTTTMVVGDSDKVRVFYHDLQGAYRTISYLAEKYLKTLEKEERATKEKTLSKHLSTLSDLRNDIIEVLVPPPE
jgi:hypothetical protein